MLLVRFIQMFLDRIRNRDCHELRKTVPPNSTGFVTLNSICDSILTLTTRFQALSTF